MKTRTKGQRFRLLLYRRFFDRLWKATLVLGLALAGVWWQGELGLIIVVPPALDPWIFLAAIVVLVFTLFAMLARNMSYVQARRDHLRVVTPFLRLKVSYRRVRSVHPAEFHQLFPPVEAGWADRRLLAPFYPETAVVVEVIDYPFSPALLRFFLPPQMFYPQMPGFVFVVNDWMTLSTEIDSLRGIYQV